MVLEVITNLLNQIDISNVILPLFIYTIIIALYALFVWFFYKSMAKKDLFHTKMGPGGTVSYILKYLIAFPVVVFLWFAGLTILLFFLSKTQTTAGILLISMGVIGAVRIAAYYKEELAMELAKIMPLAVLALFIADPTFFSLDLFWERIYEVRSLGSGLLNYFLFAIMLEFYLRISSVVINAAREKKTNNYQPPTFKSAERIKGEVTLGNGKKNKRNAKNT